MKNDKKNKQTLETTTRRLAKIIDSSCLTQAKKLMLKMALYDALSIPDNLVSTEASEYIQDDFYCDDLNMQTW